jgi:peptidyl-prolyl cis-trans isomerase B (cyclophilin B)
MNMLTSKKIILALACLFSFVLILGGCKPNAATATPFSTTGGKTTVKNVTSANPTKTAEATATATENNFATTAQSDQPTATPVITQAATPTPEPTVRIPRTFADDPAHYPVVTIEMENGDKIVAELYPHVAPNTVLNFISLINKGFYNGLTFHRIIPGFVIQGGDPTGTGTGDPGYTIDGEFTANGFVNNLKHTAGVLSMARNSINMNSAGSQFFIIVATQTSLDGNYAAFGKVISGMDNVIKIVSTPRDLHDKPLTAQIMKTVTVDTKGITYPEPYTNPK